MANKLSGWFRMFIVFAGVWTVGSINHIYFNFPKESKERIERVRDVSYLLAEGKSEKEKEELGFSDIEGNYKQQISEYHKARRNAIFLFLLYWLVPVGLVYGSGRCVGWIIRGFRKDKE